MPLQIPKLDDRNFQDIVDEMKRRIPLYCPEWTDHNVSDPGVTLIELFAWAIDQLIYRVNRVPDLHYFTFLKFLGIDVPSPAPASAELIFRLTEPQQSIVKIPQGTEISTTQTELENPYIFTVEEEYPIFPAECTVVITKPGKESENEKPKVWEKDSLAALIRGELSRKVTVFSDNPPESDDALYFGFENDLSEHLIWLELEFEGNRGTGIHTAQPPWYWEVSQGTTDVWKHCDSTTIIDGTGGMNQNGQIELTLPKMGKSEVHGFTRFWLRVRVKKPNERDEFDTMTAFLRSPIITKLVSIDSIGRIVYAAGVETIEDEILGVSNGEPGQRFYLKAPSIIGPRKPDEYIRIEIAGKPDKQWSEEAAFERNRGNGAGCYYTIDDATGEVRFPPTLLQEDGTFFSYGEIPERGATIKFTKYRAHKQLPAYLPWMTMSGYLPEELLIQDINGSLESGDIQALDAHRVNQLKTSIPYVASVNNRKPTRGAKIRPDMEVLALRTLTLLRTQDRAVTLEDYRLLVAEKFGDRIWRVQAVVVPQNPGKPSSTDKLYDAEASQLPKVCIYLIPRLADWVRDKDGRLRQRDLQLPTELQREIADYINQRQVVGMAEVEVRSMALQEVTLSVTLTLLADIYKVRAEQTVRKLLYRFIDPIQGMVNNQGWPLGAPLIISDLKSRLLREIELNRMIKDIAIVILNPTGKVEENEKILEQIDPGKHGVFVSGEHVIRSQ